MYTQELETKLFMSMYVTMCRCICVPSYSNYMYMYICVCIHVYTKCIQCKEFDMCKKDKIIIINKCTQTYIQNTCTFVHNMFIWI